MTQVCLTYDFDAVSVWLHDPELEATPTNRSRGRFGAEVGLPRLLDLHDDRDVPATWFVPGHTIESFPSACADIVDRDHEVAHHGWAHRPPADYPSADAERADLERGIEAIADLTGGPPAGYRSPSWDLSEQTLDLLVDLDFAWDSSGMARDFECYRHTADGIREDDTYAAGSDRGLPCLPVSWLRDDFPRLNVVPGAGAADEAAVFREWREGFDWAHERLAESVFVLTMHPQVIGQGHRVQRLGELVDHMAAAGAEFTTASEAVARFEAGEGR